MTTYNAEARIDLLDTIKTMTIEAENDKQAAELVARNLIESLEVNVKLTKPEVWSVKSFDKTGTETKRLQDRHSDCYSRIYLTAKEVDHDSLAHHSGNCIYLHWYL